MAGRINDIDLVVIPVASRRGSGNRDTTFLLLVHPVHGGCPVVNLTNPVNLAGIEQDALSYGRFSGVNMGNDSNVTGTL
jgi:hypothetical protein